MLKLLFIISLVTICAAAPKKLCHYQLPLLNGMVFYPLNSGQTEEHSAPEWFRKSREDLCLMYMPLETEKTIKLVFRHVDVGENEISVEIAKAQNETAWETIRNITGYKKEITIETFNVSGIRISAEKNAGRFLLFYQERFCEEPDPSVIIKDRCSRAYDLYSVCQFSCKPPQYYPAFRSIAKNFRSFCRENRTWSWNVRSACATVKEIIHSCLVDVNPLCDYDIDEIAELIPEDEKIPLNHESYKDLEFQARVEFLMKEKKGSFNTCHVHCLQNESNKTFKFECKSGALTRQQRKRCIQCRYTKDECAKHTLYV